jgi:hypothetical protein
MIKTDPRGISYMNSPLREIVQRVPQPHHYSERNKNLIEVRAMKIDHQYIVDGVAKTLTGKEEITEHPIRTTQDPRYKLTFTFNNKAEESVNRDWKKTYKEVVSDKDKDEDKDEEQKENDTDLSTAFLTFCSTFSMTAKDCITKLSAAFAENAEDTYGTNRGGKRKSRRNRKSKKSRKGKSRKNRRKSNRRR